MDELLRVGREAGLKADEVTSCLRLGRPLTETNWVLASEGEGGSLDVALEVFESGRWIEYQCYDDAGQPQGRAEVELHKWEDAQGGWFVGHHGAAQDQYYQWYVENQLQAGVVFHLCDGRASACRKKTARGDRRAVIHVDKWRMLTPQAMVEVPYLRAHGIRLGKTAIERFAEEKKAQRPPPGTGLDQAMEEAQRARVARPGGTGAERPERGRSRSPRKFKRLSDKLEARAKEKLQAREGPRGSADKEVAEAGEPKAKKKKRQRRKGRRAPAVGVPLGAPPARCQFFGRHRLGEATSGVGPRRSPGISPAAATRRKKKIPSTKKFWGTIVLTAHPPSKIGVRAHRELVTLATALDELLENNTLRCLDLLMQRFKAVEASLQDGGWSLARHYELIPPHGAQLSREDEREMATKAELRSLRLRDAALKMTRSK